MYLNISIKTRQPQQITVEEVRTELRKIEEIMVGDFVTPQSIIKLNNWLDSRINNPYGLSIKAELVNNNVKLYGYTDESKEVLDPNHQKEFISKIR